MDYHEKMAMGRALLDNHGLQDWEFDVQNLQNRALYPIDAKLESVGYEMDGMCLFEKKLIAVDCNCRKRQFKRTVLHEIAHALRGVPGHDCEWVNIAGKIGYRGAFVDMINMETLKKGLKSPGDL